MSAVMLAWLAQQGQDSPPDDFGVSEVATIISTGLAILAFGVSLSNRRTSKRALKVSLRQEARREVPYGLYLTEALRWGQAGVADQVHGVHIRVSNPADRAVAVVSADLHVQFTGDRGAVLTVKVPSLRDRTNVQAAPPVNLVELPMTVDANSAKAGWFLFIIEKSLTAGAPVDRFDLAVEDVHGRSESIQVVDFYDAKP